MFILLRWTLFSGLLLATTSALAAGMEITPFKTINQHPTIQIYGLPLDSSAGLTPSGKLNVTLIEEISSEYSTEKNSREAIIFDGESYRTTVAVKYGISDRLEAGISIPYISYDGGFLDNFIVDWHDTFGLPQGGRDSAPKDALNYHYVRDGVDQFQITSADSGIGDISLDAGLKLYEENEADFRRILTLRSDLKLPTGKSGALRGSGSTDLALALCGMTDKITSHGRVGLFGSVGALAMSESKVLTKQQNHLVGFGSAGIGWGPTDWISFKAQLNATTPFYGESSLPELADPTVVLVTGGAINFPGDYQLDIGVAEDLAVGTAPDVTFHLALSKTFN